MKARFVVPAVAVAAVIGGAGYVFAQTAPGSKLDCDVVTSAADRLTLDCTPVTEVPPSTTVPPTSAPSEESSTTTAPTETSTTPPSSSSPSTTTTVAPTSTTSPSPSTTSPPSSSVSPTTSAPPTTTTAPPSGAAFSEDFSTPGSFAQRFDFDIDSSGGGTVQGDHDMACGDPAATHRSVAQVKSEVFYQCAPGGDPAKAHVMTAVDTGGYTIAWFSPKPTFTNVKRVCWSQNLTALGGGKWTQVLFLDADEVGRSGGDLGYTSPEFPNNGGPSTARGSARNGIKIFGPDVAKWSLPAGTNASTVTWNQFEQGSVQRMLQWASFFQTADKAERFRLCLTDNETGTVTFTANHDAAHGGGSVLGGGAASSTVSGFIPNGPIRVVFEDDNYDPPKRDGYDPHDLTWHWDDIEITTR